MDAELLSRIHKLRDALAHESDPDGIGFIAPPYHGVSFPAAMPSKYREFLRVANGGVCGGIDLYEAGEIMAKQSPVMALPGGRTRWFCIGEVGENLLVMDNVEQTVHLVEAEEPAIAGESMGELDYFLLTVPFGDSYTDLVPDGAGDPWHALLQTSAYA
jgi:hypothetical protein